jgi:hypothetical protein
MIQPESRSLVTHGKIIHQKKVIEIKHTQSEENWLQSCAQGLKSPCLVAWVIHIFL